MVKKKEENNTSQFDQSEDVFQTRGQMVRCNPMVDGGFSLGFHTTELTENQKLVMMSLFGKYGTIAFREAEIFFDPKDIPKAGASDEQKTPSQRLRAVIYAVSQNEDTPVPAEKFDEYYRKEMERLINYEKHKLPD